MELLEIVLLVGGVLCIVASFLIGEKEQDAASEGINARELTEQDKEYIRNQIDTLIEEQMGEVSEKTEAALDKISNTKILEMNDYAETVMGEINRNHNETVFLYDMLNEKAKEVKSTVRDVNVAKREAAKKKSGEPSDSNAAHNSNTSRAVSEQADTHADNNGKDLAKERFVEIVKKSTERSRDMQNDSQIKNHNDINEAQPKTSKKASKQNAAKNVKDDDLRKEITKIKNNSEFGKNEVIIAMHELGLSNKDIAKELNLGVGEVNLVIGLFSSAK